MSQSAAILRSKLPATGTTIFTVMSALAAQHGAINLSQGFPDFPVPAALADKVTYHMQQGHNQYAPMQGLLPLREQISAKISRLYHRNVDPATEVTVTAGATEAIFATMAALLHPGDEVIVLEPAYDCYIPAIQLNGGLPITVPLNPDDFSVDWDKVRERISLRTRMIMINSPHNPTGSILNAEDLEQLAIITRDKDILLLSDEVYEHMVYDGMKHHSVLTHAELAEKSVAVFSFGKTFHATGWKVGYLVAPPAITAEIRKVHQYLQFSVHTPTQFALAEYMQEETDYQPLTEFYQAKRDLFLSLTQGSSLQPLKAQGTYFQLFSYAAYSKMPDRELAERLTIDKKLASIPISVFYQDKTDHHYLRFCFAKHDQTLAEAAKIIRSL
ncbi:MAG: methionine aminotransferase [Cyclobacteriaceae bacterium]